METTIIAETDNELADWASSVLVFFLEDLPLHFEEEESDLFPKLLERSENREELGAILDQLVSEHELDCGLVDPIIQHLRLIQSGEATTDVARFQSNIWSFTTALRRHLSWEETIVLPLAEKILTDKDRKELAHSFAERRQLSELRGGTSESSAIDRSSSSV